MLTTIPIGVTARNEAKNILALLDSLRAAIQHAEAALPLRFEIHVLLNDNTDDTPALLADAADVHVWYTTGGLIEAQRFLVERWRGMAPFVVFTDADILIGEHTLAAVAGEMLANSGVEIVYAEKYPVRPMRTGLLAQALYLFNLREGYQSRRPYLNGQFFAIRNWNIPRAAELTWDPARNNPFLHLEAGIRADDIYLSRECLARAGESAIQCVPEGIRYRPPETLSGMYRKYQRMMLEIERLNHYFPRMAPAHRRRLDQAKLQQAPLRERCDYKVFQAALLVCRLRYAWQRYYYSRWASSPCPSWLPVVETKERLS